MTHFVRVEVIKTMEHEIDIHQSERALRTVHHGRGCDVSQKYSNVI